MVQYAFCTHCGLDKFPLDFQGRCKDCAPAQEEKKMGFDVRCKKCDREHSAPSWDTKYCRECAKDRAADLRQRWDRAYFAALTGLSSPGYLASETVTKSAAVADEVIRRHAELMAARGAVIAEVE